MKQSVRVTFSALMAALATVFVLAAYIPYITFAAPALAGCVIMIVLIEVDYRWAFGAYLVAALLSMILAEREAGIIFLGFFGFYPIVKSLLERLPNRIIEWVLKLAVFNAAVILIYSVFAPIVGVDITELGGLGKYSEWIFLLLGNIVFILYDFALVRVATLYLYRIHPQVQKMFRS